VEETGSYDAREGVIALEGRNPWSGAWESGINIRSRFRISADEIQLEVSKLRESGRWESGYRSRISRSEK